MGISPKAMDGGVFMKSPKIAISPKAAIATYLPNNPRFPVAALMAVTLIVQIIRIVAA